MAKVSSNKAQDAIRVEKTLTEIGGRSYELRLSLAGIYYLAQQYGGEAMGAFEEFDRISRPVIVDGVQKAAPLERFSSDAIRIIAHFLVASTLHSDPYILSLEDFDDVDFSKLEGLTYSKAMAGIGMDNMQSVFVQLAMAAMNSMPRPKEGAGNPP